MSYTLQQLVLTGNASLEYGNQHPFLRFDLQTSAFLINNAMPILTLWQQNHPRGTLQAQIKGSGNPENFVSMNYNGTIKLTGMSFQPEEHLKPVSALNGTVTLQGNAHT